MLPGMYIARPFNFNVSPLFIEEDRLGINRDVTLSSSAVHFLMKNNFDMGAVFTDGVSYLSREEAVTARKIYAEKEDRAANMADISIAPSDQEALKFLRKARETVASWTGAKKVCLKASAQFPTAFTTLFCRSLSCLLFFMFNRLLS